MKNSYALCLLEEAWYVHVHVTNAYITNIFFLLDSLVRTVIYLNMSALYYLMPLLSISNQYQHVNLNVHVFAETNTFG